MVDPPPYAERSDSPPAAGSPPATPRWVKAFGAIALALVLLFVILHLTGGGFRSHMGH